MSAEKARTWLLLGGIVTMFASMSIKNGALAIFAATISGLLLVAAFSPGWRHNDNNRH